MEQSEATESLEIHGLTPEPAAEWQRLLAFVGLGAADKRAMSRTVEVLMSRATEMVIGVYDYLQSVPATAAVLGWENGADPHHLEERRRFFTIWLSRVLGLDTSDEFAAHLFRAGKYHAAHGPRHIHVPPAYVTMSIGMMGAAFARIMGEAGLPGDVIGPAMAGWNKYLAVQLHLMDMGYRAAIEFGGGESPLTFALYGRLRQVTGRRTLCATARPGDTLEDGLRRFFNYVPELRADCLRPVWHSHEKDDSSWVEVYESYAPAPGGWRFLLNGRNAAYADGFAAALCPGDTISIFPPGR